MNNFYDEAEKVLKRLDDKVTLIAAQLKMGANQNPEDIFFDNQEMLKLMNISKRTLQEWRDTNYIGFSQLGNKIYYTLADVQKLMKENYNPKK
jgi:hypothetical protein